MSNYTIKVDHEMQITRIGADMLEIGIGGETARVLTEDLAAVVAEELPKDRAKDLLSAVEEKMVSKGKIRIRIKAGKDMKKGEEIRATMDITRYVDDVDRRAATKNGLIIPSFAGIRTNNQGFII